MVLPLLIPLSTGFHFKLDKQWAFTSLSYSYFLRILWSPQLMNKPLAQSCWTRLSDWTELNWRVVNSLTGCGTGTDSPHLSYTLPWLRYSFSKHSSNKYSLSSWTLSGPLLEIVKKQVRNSSCLQRTPNLEEDMDMESSNSFWWCIKCYIGDNSLSSGIHFTYFLPHLTRPQKSSEA